MTRTPPSRRDRAPVLEALEPRILYAADATPLVLVDGAGWASSVAAAAPVAGVSVAAPQTAGPAAFATSEQPARELALVDARVPDAQRLIAALEAQRQVGRPIDVVVIGTDQDGIAALGDALADPAAHYSAVHLFAHGDVASLRLGASSLDLAALRARGDEIAAWSHGLNGDADLMLWGCDVGAGPEGRALVEGLAALTGADVAASDDATGGLAAGGNWTLEVASGAIEATVPIDAALQQDFAGRLTATAQTATPVTLPATTRAPEDGTGASSAARQIATGANGSVVVWVSDPGTAKIYAQRIDTTGAAVGAAVVVSTGTGTVTGQLAVAMDDRGNVVIAWTETSSTGSFAIQAARIAAGANSAQWVTRVDAGTEAFPGSVLRTDPTIALSSSGQYGVIAYSYSSGTTSSILARRFTVSGSSTGWDGLSVIASTSGIVSAHADVAVGDDGTMVAVWEGTPTASGGSAGRGIWLTRVAANGTELATVRISDSTLPALFGASESPWHAPTVALASDGNAMVAWRQEARTASGRSYTSSYSIVGRTVSASGTLGTTQRIDSGSEIPARPSIAALGASGFVVAWDESATAGGVRSIVARTFGANGLVDGAEFRVDDGSARDWRGPSVAGYRSRLILSWAGTPTSGPGDLLQVRSYSWTAPNLYPPVIVSNGGGVATAIGLAENTTAVTTVQATDPDGSAATISYAIAGGMDAGLFTINASTGALNFVRAPNYEAPADADRNNVYEVIVSASDGTYAATQTIAVIVTPVNETAPVIISNGGGASATVSVAENVQQVTMVVATDADQPLPTLTYSISGGTDAGRFSIDAWSGLLSFTSPPDFEAPADSDANNTYQVIVSASDGTFVDTQVISVKVTPVNDVAPVITSNGGGASASVSVAENVTTVTAVTAIDADRPTSSALNYSIVGGADASRFVIDSQKGTLAFVVAPDYEAPSDTDANNVYEVIVAANDGAFSATQTIVVSVTPVNDVAPTITSDGGGDKATIGVAENVAAVTTLTATDADRPSGTLSYSIAGGADAGRFAIDAVTGALVFVEAPDYEAPADSDRNNVYQVIVAASDGTFVDRQTITVSVTPVNEFAPVITSDNGGAVTAIGVAENATSVTKVTATDADRSGSVTSYSIIGGADAGRFLINPGSGELRFAVAPDYEAPADADANNVYEVIVAASDGTFSATQTIIVMVTPVEEFKLRIVSDGGADTAKLSVAEHVTTVTTVVAADGDLPSMPVIYSISGGADASLFQIDESTGVLAFATAPDYEAPADSTLNNVYHVTVTATAGSKTVSQKLAVTVLQVNEAPTIGSDGGGDAATFSVAENDTAVTVVQASDADLPAQLLRYAIVGGADAGRFTIDEVSGVLRFASAPDYDVPGDSSASNVYEVIVAASDGELTDTQTLAVFVTPLNDLVPTITSDGGDEVTLSVAENDPVVTTVEATDADQSSETLGFAIVGGADAGRFTIDSATGELRFASAPDYEAPEDADANNVYEVIVEASDGTFAATQTITVTVTPVNDTAPAITSDGGGASATVDVEENASTVTTVAATDADLPEQVVGYSIVGGADAARFVIDAETGKLRFASAPDYDAPEDADANNVYEVVVEASDGTFAATQTITVTVTPVNDTAPAITSNGGGETATIGVAENTSAVTTVHATDADVPAGAPSYSIVGGTDAGHFTIDADTGELRFASAPDYEAPTDADANNAYQVIVAASDGRSSITQTITVTVTPVNEYAPTIVNGGGSTLVVGVSENSTSVLTVVATDADRSGQALSYSIVGGADAAHFEIDAATGVVHFTAPPDYDIPGDADADNVYELVVAVSDGTSSDTLSIAVTLRSVEEFAPVIVSNGGGDTAAVSVTENTLVVTTVAAIDADLPKPMPRYTIVGGTDAGRFAIDESTGELRFASTPDYEVPADADANNVYEVTVAAGDGTFVDTQTITVTVTPVNDLAPEITSDGGGASASVSVAENASAVTTVTAADADVPAGTLRYSIVGGADAGRFAIDAVTGALRFASAPNYEAPVDADANNVYQVIVAASDGTFTDQQAIAVTVTPVNDVAPTIISNGGGASAWVRISENLTAVARVVASDADRPSGTLTYTISGGADADRFEIDAVTGALRFASAPDYEAPVDADADNVYQVIVAASDGTFVDTQTITVTVTPVNDVAPEITSDGGEAIASVSVAENTSAVTTVTATDADRPSGTLRYGIAGGVDARRFAIDSTTGALRFVNAPDYDAPGDSDGDNVYEVVVAVSDGKFVDRQQIAVAVTPVNDAVPTITSNGGGATAQVDVSENAVSVTTVAAIDADRPSESLSYAIVGGADAGRFTIDAVTGELSFAIAPDYEAPTDGDANNVYQVIVAASDGTFTDTQTLVVTVTPVNDFAPTITSDGGGETASVAVAENASAVTTVTATDADLPIGAPGYAIVGGADAASFEIDSTTGELRFASAPDFESPADADADNVYEVIVSASDGAFTATQTIAVTVTAVNDLAPTITSNGGGWAASVTVDENSSEVTTVAASDADQPSGTLTYSIEGGADADRFAIDAVTGELRFASAPDYEAPTDTDADNVYQVIVSASDGTYSATQTLTVAVAPLNDAVPTIDSDGGGDTAVVTVAENVASATTVVATDTDWPAGALVYSIVGGTDAGQFTIDAVTGELRFAAAPDYEAPTDADIDNVYEVIVEASDGTYSAIQTIAVTVTPVNDAAPTITSDGGGSNASVGVAENDTLVTTVVGADSDAPSEALGYSIVGGADAAIFEIDATTGELRFVAAPDYEAPTDTDADNVYEVIVAAGDGTFSITQSIVVTVTPVNEWVPTLTSDGGGESASVSIEENVASVTTVTATDADLPSGWLDYVIVGGADAASFEVDATTGALRFVAAPDYEAPTDADADNVYEVIVAASDGAFIATQTIAVSVTPVDDAAPTITSDGGGANASVSVAENDTLVTSVAGADSDAPSEALGYSIVGGADAASFEIDAATGELRFVAAPDYEAPTDSDANNIYQVIVSTSDGTYSATQTIAVTVAPVNDAAPTITSDGGGANASVAVAENGTLVTTVAGADSDAPSEALGYSIVGGADAGRFTIDATTGELRFAVAPDYEAPTDAGADNVYEVIVEASDGTFTATQTIAVTVTPVNDAAPTITSDGGGANASVVVAENGTLVTTVVGADSDAPAAALGYSIVGGADAGRFTIDATTGELRFAAAPDYEAPTDADANNVYEVIVEAGDGTFGTTQAITVTVTPVDDNPPVIRSDGGGDVASIAVAENSTAVTTVVAPDADSPAPSVRYTLSGGADAARFAIDEATGLLSFVVAPDHEAPADSDGDGVYEVTVRASAGAFSDTQTLRVAVIDVNEAPTVQAPAAVDVVEDTPRVLSAADGTALRVADPDASQAALVIEISVDRGTVALARTDGLSLDTAADASTVRFQGAPTDIAAALAQLLYRPPADGNGAATLSFAAIDPVDARLAARVQIALAIAPVNDAPVVYAGTQAVVLAGEPVKVGPGQLRANDIDSAPSAIVYTVAALPAEGRLLLDGRELATGARFTQADVDAGRLAVVGTKAGGLTAQFDVTDASGASGGRATVRIVVAERSAGASASSVASGGGSAQAGAAGASSTSFQSADAGASQAANAGARGAADGGRASATVAVAGVSASAPTGRGAGATGGRSGADARGTPTSGAFSHQGVGFGAASGEARDAAGGTAAGSQWTQYAHDAAESARSRAAGDAMRAAIDATRAGDRAAGAARTATASVAQTAWSPIAQLARPEFREQLAQVREQATHRTTVDRVLSASTMAATASLSVLYGAWLLRGGALLTSLLASMPAWRSIDPLPVLGRVDGDARDDRNRGESLREMLGRAARERQRLDDGAPAVPAGKPVAEGTT